MLAFRFIQSGAIAGVLIGLFEYAYLVETVGDTFEGRGERAIAVLCLITFLGGAGALAGLIESLIARLLWRFPTRLRHFGAAIVALPLVALFCSQIFNGPRARRIPGHSLYATLAGALLLGAISYGFRLVGDLDQTSSRRRKIAILMLCVSAFALYLADQKAFPRLYFFFHVGLGLITFACLQSAVWLAAPAPRRRWAILWLSLGPLGLHGFIHHRPLRAITIERSQVAAPLLRVALPARKKAMPGHGTAKTILHDTHPAAIDPRFDGADLFLITVDALRADRLTRSVMPNLSRLAEQGVIFDEAYAQVPHTSFSVATLLTGKYVYSLSALGLDAARHETLPEVLRRERYKTAAFFPPAVFYIDRERLRALETSAYGFEYVKYEFLPAPARTDQVIEFLQHEQPAHAFVWVHYFEPHEPYDLHPGHLPDGPPKGAATAQSDEERYDGEVRFVDQEIARLIEALRRTRPHAIVVVSADHGEEFGEHGGRYHGTTLYDEQVRVPLVFLSLDGRFEPRRVHGPVGLVDLAPTLLSLISVVPSARMQGRDLSPYMVGSGPVQGMVFGEIDHQKMAVTHDEKLVCDLESDTCQMFDRNLDPKEKHPLRDETRLSELRGRLDEWMTEVLRFEAPSKDDPRETKEEQQAIELGRLGDRSAIPALAEMLRSNESMTREAAILLCRLPPAPETTKAFRRLLTSPDPELLLWARVGLARLGDEVAKEDLRRELGRVCSGGRTELCARAALATDDVPALAIALEQVTDDEPLELALIEALGHSRDRRARDPLLIALGRVRTRKQTVEALTALGDPTVLPFIERWIAWDPYIPVREAMAHLLAALGRSEPRREALATLRALVKVEHEPTVMAAVVEALGALGAGEVWAVGKRELEPLRPGELWLVGRGEGTVTAFEKGGKATTASMQSGVTRILVTRRARLRLQPADGIALKWAFFRDQPTVSRSQAR
jgi:arylsulfatase A-like enzyme/HEAT repeat protein